MAPAYSSLPILAAAWLGAAPLWGAEPPAPATPPVEVRLCDPGARVVWSRGGRLLAAAQVRLAAPAGTAPAPVLAEAEAWGRAPVVPCGGEGFRPAEVPLAGKDPAAPRLSILIQARPTAAGARVLVSPDTAALEEGSAPPLELILQLFPDEKGNLPELTGVDAPPSQVATPDPPKADGKPFRATRISFTARDRPRVELARSAPAAWSLHTGKGSLFLRSPLLPHPRAPGRPGTFLFYLGTEWDPGPVDLAPLRLDRQLTPAWDFVEGSVRVYAAGADPYAYDELTVMAEIVFPSAGAEPAKILRLPCFFCEGPPSAPFEGEFRFRFAPPAPGLYGVRVTTVVEGRVTRGEAVALRAGAPSSAGFVRARAGERVLRRDDGQVFLPVGMDLTHTKREGGAGEYRRCFVELARNGGNAARIGLSSWALPLEGPRAGQLDLNVAAALDEILLAAQARGVHLVLSVENSADLGVQFPKHPYARDQGGPLPAPAEFFKDLVAVRLFKRRLTYLAARYGAYRSLLAWEVFTAPDEVWTQVKADPDDPRVPAVEADRSRMARRSISTWAAQMAQHLEAMDGHAHPVTVSVALPPEKPWVELDKTAGIAWVGRSSGDSMDVHAVPGTARDEAALLRAWAEAARGVGRAHKPYWLSGPDLDEPKGADVPLTERGRNAAHDVLLASLAAGCAGTPMAACGSDPALLKERCELLRGPACFAEALAELATRCGPQNVRELPVQENPLQPGYSGPTGLCVWLRRGQGPHPDDRVGGEMVFPPLQPGSYEVKQQDAWTGEIQARYTTTRAPETQGPLRLPLPSLKRDALLVIRPAPAGQP